MASGGEDVWVGVEILTVTWPEDLRLFSPVTFDVQIGGTPRSTCFKLFMNDICIDMIDLDETNYEELSFNCENINLSSIGKTVIVEIKGFDENEEMSNSMRSYYISTPTLAESVYDVFAALRDILVNGGYDVSEAEGLFSLIDILGGI